MADITLTLPDGNQRNYPAGITGLEVAKDISTSLGKKAISCSVDGEHRDLSRPIDADAGFAI
ncbi:MAG: TGS domain-containing protein, partial [Proteobacteria bacterium]|nr:TGS domain-containing protein [Pseudomonadota bacterium]